MDTSAAASSPAASAPTTAPPTSSLLPGAISTAPPPVLPVSFAPTSSVYTAPIITLPTTAASSSSSMPALGAISTAAGYQMATPGYQMAGFPPGFQPGFPNHPFMGTPGVVSIASAITIRLTCENYLIWRAQVAPLLRSHLLMGYVDGSSVCPAAHTIADHGGVMVPQHNPLHQHWVQQDQAILFAFVSSMTESVVGMVMFATTAREAWETLADAFAATTIARSSGLRQQMAELKKRDMTMHNYFHKMKALSDELTSIGQPLRDSELISYLLAGLGTDYDALYEVVNARTTPMPIRDLYAQLITTEQRKSTQRAETGQHHYPAAHFGSTSGAPYSPAPPPVAYGAPRGGFRPQYRPDQRPQQPTWQPKPPSSGAPNNPNNNSRATIVCQLCGVPRHTASKCFKRFNRDFLGVGNDGSNTERQIAMAANAVAYGIHGGQQASVDPAWYADSGATHHITHELDKLTTREPYHGNEQVHTANGAGTARGARLEVLTPENDVSSHVDTSQLPHDDQEPVLHGLPSGLVPVHGWPVPGSAPSGPAPSRLPEETHAPASPAPCMQSPAPCMRSPGPASAATDTDADRCSSPSGHTPPLSPGHSQQMSPAHAAELSPACTAPLPLVPFDATTPSSVPPVQPSSSAKAPSAPVSRPTTHRSHGIVQPKIRTDGTVAWSSILAAREASKDTAEPCDYRDALRIPHWRAAMETEFSALQENGTSNLVPPVSGINLIDSKWVFKVKLRADG
ncbi:hypothetical protein QYE76_045254 [Lolium multiflorum]|uniref:Retrotransposon Copia-like N-terminal domain-containing protein n=1 Tax=Lolium multiflorum TaxID=4521 RepID=A0AAD8WZL8_LOLMU|nr:hypothetical protein QYE76_045254 [Lolium multiflorum]